MANPPVEKFWMVWVEGQGSPQHKHLNNTLAFQEAERLAQFNPGRNVFVLEATDYCKIGELTWQRLY